MTELKPCPFCESNSTEIVVGFDDDTPSYQFACMDCGASSGWWGDKNTAILRWNTRHYPAEVQQALDKQKPELAIITKEGGYFPDIDVYSVECPDCGNVLRYELLKRSATNRIWHCMDCGKKMNVRIDAEVEDE